MASRRSPWIVFRAFARLATAPDGHHASVIVAKAPRGRWTVVAVAGAFGGATLRQVFDDHAHEIIAEDARFYEHRGVDWDAVREAAEKDWEKRSLRVGASTITQQLAKNLYLSPARTPWRKLRELAMWVNTAITREANGKPREP